MIAEETVEIAVKLADRFDDKRILVDAENYLIATKGMKLVEKLYMASRYNLQTLLNDCMVKMDSREKIIEMKGSTKYDDLTNQIKDELFELLIDVTE
ncbi:hypothetical protein PENTCL1PPCAC_23291 [Pristionchus entomophagus]|uniref:Uncharacterized protein n=1 Tax=Pristionchus entomophagus TaxID=358040 RepID=A0AAV5U2Z5_9BILA|nr:hypothetical protein PENTCL1PPCAC_23291 [Pristionchus entomophagus]